MSSFSTVQAQSQIGGTCYAHAAARVINRALRKLKGFRNEADNENKPFINYSKILTHIVPAHAQPTDQGADIKEVFERFVDDPNNPFIHQDLRLQVIERKVLQNSATLPKDVRDSIDQHYEVACTFGLSKSQWDEFKDVVRRGCISSRNNFHRLYTGQKSYHAVVLRSYEVNASGATILHFVNSWGRVFGNKGIFSIELPSVLGDLTFYPMKCYIDIDRPGANYQRFIDNARNFNPRVQAELEPVCEIDSQRVRPVVDPSTGFARRLGGGGSANVFEAVYDGTCSVAIKSIHTDDPADRIQDKYKLKCRDIWYSFEHKNIIEDVGYYLENSGSLGQFFVHFVTIKAKHGSLKNVRDNNIPFVFSEIMSDLINALVYLEGLGIVHGDICDQNILVDEDESRRKVAVIADFGAMVNLNKSIRHTVNQNLGHNGYFAPEMVRVFLANTQAANTSLESVLSHKVDIFALGKVLVYLLTGNASTEVGRITAADENVKRIINMCLRENPEERPSATELRRFILDNWTSNYPILAKTAEQLSRSLNSVSTGGGGGGGGGVVVNPAHAMAEQARENARLATNLPERDKRRKNGSNGTYTFVYLGQLRAGLMEGLGVKTWSNGDKYEGMFRDDKKHGQGIHRWPDGSIYEGSYENGKRHGRGKMTYPDGRVEDGLWKDDIFQG